MGSKLWSSRPRRVIVTASLALATLTACTVTLDTSQIEEEIATGIEDQTDIDVDTVDCPEDIEVQAGATFDCTVTGSDGTTVGTARVTQENDEGRVTWELLPA